MSEINYCDQLPLSVCQASSISSFKEGVRDFLSSRNELQLLLLLLLLLFILLFFFC